MDNDLYQQGLALRREVLGNEHVENSLRNADDFSMPLQDLVIQVGWGQLWSRPGLDRKTRSFLTIAMLTALNRPHELRVHLRGAINNGLTKEEIRETFIHAAGYCGFPAALDSFRIAREVFKELEL